jgi:hypothetical protein
MDEIPGVVLLFSVSVILGLIVMFCRYFASQVISTIQDYISVYTDNWKCRRR